MKPPHYSQLNSSHQDFLANIETTLLIALFQILNLTIHHFKSSAKVLMYTLKDLNQFSINKPRNPVTCHCLVLLLLLTVTSFIQTSTVFASSNSTQFSSDRLGLIVAQTQTPTGHQFCQAFLSHWRDLPDIESINLTIAETVSPLNGLQIGIYFSGKLVFQTSLSQTNETDPTLSKQVSEVVHYRVMAQNNQQGRWFDPDLAPDEW